VRYNPSWLATVKIDELVRLSENRELLHIVSGHSVGGTLRSSDVPSDNVVIWFDLLTTGPTLGTNLEETTRNRKRFFHQSSRSRQLNHETVPPPSYPQRNRVLRHCGEWREIALWFGPSVMEQFSLLQILAAISEQTCKGTRVALVTCPRFGFAVYRPEELSNFFKSRVLLSRKQIALARKAWELYGASDPMPLFRFARKHLESAPVLCNALIRQLQRYPSVRNGLSVSEEALLREVDVRGTVVRTVGHVLGNDDHFLTGDDELFESLLEFLTCKYPLIEPVEKGHKISSFAEFRRLAVKRSAAGHDAIDGRVDQVALNGTNRWIGGVHLKGKAVPWRWDSEKSLLKAC
jgi:hypothetical protein